VYHNKHSGILGRPVIESECVDRPKLFNLVMGFADPTLTVDQLSAAGVKRISVGGAMSRVALAAFLQSAREMKEKGSFTFVTGMAPIRELRDGFAAGGGEAA
jgi:2-methylisocitrate lyase-like PEP mutase family enzyme